jgi:hypothetical protein
MGFPLCRELPAQVVAVAEPFRLVVVELVLELLALSATAS